MLQLPVWHLLWVLPSCVIANIVNPAGEMDVLALLLPWREGWS